MKKGIAGVTPLRSRVVKFLENNPEPGVEAYAMSPERLIEEIHIHQIELEMQNEDLRLARENAERIQAKYIDLYDCAPVGYLTLGEKGKIVEANLTAANLLGTEKSKIVYRPLTDFVDEGFQDILYFILAKGRNSGGHESCELKLKKCGEKTFFALLESKVSVNQESGRTEIRISVININAS
jgi:PAS domain-containing protein